MTTPDQHEIAVRAAAKAVLAQESFLGGEQDAEGDARIAIDAYTNTLREAEADSVDAAEEREAICGVICAAGRLGEPLACAWEPGHNGLHSWATLPTFPSDAVPVQADRLNDLWNERERLREALERIVQNIERDGYASPALLAILAVARAALSPPPEQQGEGG